MSTLYEKYGGRSVHELDTKVKFITIFGHHNVPVVDFECYVEIEDPKEFVVAFDKNQEDWSFTEELSMYFVEDVVGLLVNNDPCTEGMKERYLSWLKSVVSKLEN